MSFIVSSQPKAGPYNPSTLVSGQRLFVLYDRGFFAGFDAKSGRELYAQQRLPNGRAFTASPWAADGKIACLNEDGVTFVAACGQRQVDEVACGRIRWRRTTWAWRLRRLPATVC
ncbi:MAG UNVERIFIED_CONTAM: PQQ-like beta-propeller repeat protein [Planctomycetaceae bacterium]|jgi:hypothetical protein